MKKEGEIMPRILNQINDIKIPPQVAREIGLSENWKKSVSPKKVENIINSATRFKDALRKLSKN